MKEEFEFVIKNDFKKLKIELFLHRINRKGFGNIVLEIPNEDNFINISYVVKNASSNLENINENKNNILSNLEKINNISNNIYLKNVYDVLFYNKKLQSLLIIYFMKNRLKLMHP